MSRERRYINPVTAEKEMDKARKEAGIFGRQERERVEELVSGAQEIGNKRFIKIRPCYVHIPEWQRSLLDLNHARDIGMNYNEGKWDCPKIYEKDGRLIVIDGMHRIYGAFLVGRPFVLVEFLNISEIEAIFLFLDQSRSKWKLRPCDYVKAYIAAGEPEYVAFRDLCHSNNLTFTGDADEISNPVGKLTAIRDGIGLCKQDPELFDRIIRLINKLRWNGNDNRHVYGSFVIRTLRNLYSFYKGNEEQMEKILLVSCAGDDWYYKNMQDKTQRQMFDFLSDIIQRDIDKIAFIAQMRKTS